MQVNQTPTMIASVRMARGTRVVRVGGKLEPASSSQLELATLVRHVNTADTPTAILPAGPGVRIMVASEPIMVGDEVFLADDGKVAKSGSVSRGIATSDATGDNQEVNVMTAEGAGGGGGSGTGLTQTQVDARIRNLENSRTRISTTPAGTQPDAVWPEQTVDDHLTLVKNPGGDEEIWVSDGTSFGATPSFTISATTAPTDTDDSFGHVDRSAVTTAPATGTVPEPTAAELTAANVEDEEGNDVRIQYGDTAETVVWMTRLAGGWSQTVYKASTPSTDESTIGTALPPVADNAARAAIPAADLSEGDSFIQTNTQARYVVDATGTPQIDLSYNPPVTTAEAIAMDATGEMVHGQRVFVDDIPENQYFNAVAGGFVAYGGGSPDGFTDPNLVNQFNSLQYYDPDEITFATTITLDMAATVGGVAPSGEQYITLTASITAFAVTNLANGRYVTIDLYKTAGDAFDVTWAGIAGDAPVFDAAADYQSVTIKGTLTGPRFV